MNLLLHNTGLVHLHPHIESTLVILGLAIAAGLWWMGTRQTIQDAAKNQARRSLHR